MFGRYIIRNSARMLQINPQQIFRLFGKQIQGLHGLIRGPGRLNRPGHYVQEQNYGPLSIYTFKHGATLVDLINNIFSSRISPVNPDVILKSGYMLPHSKAYWQQQAQWQSLAQAERTHKLGDLTKHERYTLTHPMAYHVANNSGKNRYATSTISPGMADVVEDTSELIRYYKKGPHSHILLNPLYRSEMQLPYRHMMEILPDPDTLDALNTESELTATGPILPEDIVGYYKLIKNYSNFMSDFIHKPVMVLQTNPRHQYRNYAFNTIVTEDEWKLMMSSLGFPIEKGTSYTRPLSFLEANQLAEMVENTFTEQQRSDPNWFINVKEVNVQNGNQVDLWSIILQWQECLSQFKRAV